jgi:uncharacterized membrane protein YdcZ (DUF606 family)
MSFDYLMPILIGVGIAVQVAILGKASSTIPPAALSMALQGAGLLVGAVWAFATHSWREVISVTQLWWWVPLGALGWGLVGLLAFSSGKIGPGATLALSIGSQLIAAVVIELALNRFGISPTGAIGVGLIIIGGVLIAR